MYIVNVVNCNKVYHIKDVAYMTFNVPLDHTEAEICTWNAENMKNGCKSRKDGYTFCVENVWCGI